MVDCRLCKYGYKIWKEELVHTHGERFKIVCLKKEMFIDWEYVPNDPCEDYVDVDCDLS